MRAEITNYLAWIIMKCTSLSILCCSDSLLGKTKYYHHHFGQSNEFQMTMTSNHEDVDKSMNIKDAAHNCQSRIETMSKISLPDNSPLIPFASDLQPHLSIQSVLYPSPTRGTSLYWAADLTLQSWRELKLKRKWINATMRCCNVKKCLPTRWLAQHFCCTFSKPSYPIPFNPDSSS